MRTFEPLICTVSAPTLDFHQNLDSNPRPSYPEVEKMSPGHRLYLVQEVPLSVWTSNVTFVSVTELKILLHYKMSINERGQLDFSKGSTRKLAEEARPEFSIGTVNP
ncbi:hypothetical protein AVEN_241941-1 [Araneus ventricosus]|uniref:Uncharacterized protein n=1 Tax=Araneus ventricosus TaxID=182803 RepID=A0A4Y2QME5_ARAVE|nr:hypothetical protein AVEN_129658-1 [Araneus ventricosus]GBN64524.1 hypothetical protein AVEN_218820-1 [Araneus ventricosus]GBO36798.1 hypothetical protein AVEN_15392-1 [Araneus ventricosus]GBO36878.1 hypothetical protein AVEN_241941-1 [Araneus ventricosus]